MVRYQVVLAYDGTAFRGMQRQVGDRTVQGEVESALAKIGWRDKSILAAGRTDTGVHASGQVIAFDLDWQHTLNDLKNALNANMPHDVAVKQINLVRESFHPRYDAISRVYEYQIFCQPDRDPLRERFAWRVWPEIDLDLINKCAEYLVGEHDFSAFGTPPKEGGSTLRTVFQASWQQHDDTFTFKVTGNAFLYHMVRRMVCLQVEVGQGHHDPDILAEYLSPGITGMVKGLAPAQGLCLMKVNYPEAIYMRSNLMNEE